MKRNFFQRSKDSYTREIGLLERDFIKKSLYLRSLSTGALDLPLEFPEEPSSRMGRRLAGEYLLSFSSFSNNLHLQIQGQSPWEHVPVSTDPQEISG